MLKNIKYTLAFLLLAMNAAPAHSEGVISGSGYSETMLDMVNNMQNILFGIMVEDYNQVANIAEDIAYHPGPALEKRLALLDKLEMEAMTFKLHEDRVRQNALTLMKAAERPNRVEVLESFADLATSCTECHITYREKVRSLHR